jgi:glycosyltransferase involved in cell wall biosynthesis
MNIVFFTHPSFQSHQSMPRFAKMLCDGMSKRGHQVSTWSPKARFYSLPVPHSLKKWMGYIDQYVLFPIETHMRMQKCAKDTLFVFTDHALGPWIPLAANRPHAIHCHDFLAQRSALGEIEQNRTGWSGRKYQSFIFKGYSKGKHFISVSEKTRQDLKHFLPVNPITSVMVYNGLNQSFVSIEKEEALRMLSNTTGMDLSNGFLLHVGGNQWYKNRIGVIEIYNAWRASSGLNTIPLLLIGYKPDDSLQEVYECSNFKQDIKFLTGLEDEMVRMAYAGASVFLFPSLAEGFGWPIAEAMASGCRVVTTNAAPMTEVAGNAAELISVRTQENSTAWAKEGADAIERILKESEEQCQMHIQKGIENARRFDAEDALNKIEAVYKKIIKNYDSPQ